MDTKKLRQKILDLAIHGKLVPQDPNDEPASVLLERIRAEKEQLIKEGKIKAPKKTKTTGDTSHYGKEGPWGLPEGWQWSTLGDICSKVVDGDHNPPPSETTPTEYLMISSKNVLDNCLDGLKEVRYLSRSVFEECNKRTRLEKGDILLTTVGTLGRSCIFDGSHNIVLQRSVSVLTPLILGDYVKCYLDSGYFQHYIENNARGTAQKGFYLNLLEATYLPIPPLNEQRKIVGKAYSLLSELRGIDNETSVLNDRIIKAKNKILDLAIKGHLVPHDPADVPAIELLKRINPHFVPSHNLHYGGTIPNGWLLLTYNDVADYINGRAFKPEEWESDGMPIIRIQNLNEPCAPYNYSSGSFEKQYRVQKGDLLFAWAASLGVYIWKGQDAWLNQHIFKVNPFSYIDKEYLYFALSASINDFYQKSHGSGMVHITRKQFVSMPLLLPPINEQKRIIKAVKACYKVLDEIAAGLK